MLKKIKIENFKRIQSLDLELGKINVLVGSNNSGKTSVLQAIQFAIGTAQTAKINNAYQKNNMVSYSGASSSFQYLPLLEVEALIYEKKLTQNSGSIITFSQAAPENELKISFKRGKNRNVATNIEGISLYNQFTENNQIYCVFIPGLSGIALSEEYRASAIVNKSATRGDSNLYLRNILYSLNKKTEAWGQFEESVSMFFPEYRFIVKYDDTKDENIVVNIMRNNIELPLDAMGTSALQIVQILSYIFHFEPKLIVLDEPDTHLHPNNQRKMMRELIRLSVEKDIQIILSTHSRHILDEAIDEAKIIWLNDGNVQDSENHYTQLLLELGALDKTDFLSNPDIEFVFCTEDEKQLDMLPYVLKASGFDMNKTVVIPYYGCGKVDNARLLCNFIGKYAPAKKIIIHRDRDYLTDDEVNQFIQELSEDHVKVYVTTGTDIEAIYLSAEHINYLYSALTIENITDLIEEAIIGAKDTSIEKYINYRCQKSSSRNHGAISRDCNMKYSQSPLRYTFGKKALGLLKSNLQHIIGANPNLFRQSEFIRQANLVSILSDFRSET